MKRRGRLLATGKDWGYRAPFLQDGTWRYRRRHLRDGEVLCGTLQAKSRAAARAEVVELAQAERTAAPEPRDARLGEVVEGWLGTVDVKPVSRRDLESCSRVFLGKLGGPERRFGEISLQDLERLFFTEWADLKGQTKRKYRSVLARIWQYAEDHSFATANLPRKLRPPRKWREEIKAAKKVGRALSLEEARLLLGACEGDVVVRYKRTRHGRVERIRTKRELPGWLWWFTFLGLRTGLRRSNLIGSRDKPGLLWRHVNLKSRMLEVPGVLMKNGTDLRLPLHDEAVEELARIRPRPRRPADEKRILGEPVIRGAEGCNLAKAFAAAVARSGIAGNVRPHDLRHSFASWIGGVCPEAVATALLHQDGGTITSRYTGHQGLELLRSELAKLPRIKKNGLDISERGPLISKV